MLNLSVLQLSIEAHSYPLSLRDQLRTGDPVEITAMATAFAKAANDQTLAAELATQQLQLTFGGYESDQATPIDYSAEVQTTSQTLGGNAAALLQIATTLDSIADALAAHTHTAIDLVDQLEIDLDNLGRSYWAKAETGVWPPEDLEQLAVSLHNSGVGLVASCGASVQAAVEDYEAVLAGAQMALADLGYIAPDALDEGPGDVGVPAPQNAAQQVIQITGTPPTPGLALALVGATAYLALLNRKAGSGIPLTPTEQAWLTSYYEQTLPYFPQIKTWADQAPPEGTGAVTQIADGLLALSLVVPYSKLPQALIQLLASNVGTEQPGWNGTQVGPRPLNWPPAGDPTLDRATATLGLLADYSSADAEPSAELAQNLKDAAIRWKQQTNAMYANYVYDVQTWTPSYTGQTPPVLLTDEQWNALFPDAASSDALTLVAKNEACANDWIVNDPTGRRTVMAMNWDDGSGAAAVLLSAGLPSESVEATSAAQAALLIVQDASTDYLAFADMSNSTVDAAIATVGITYIDSFASPDSGVPGVSTLTMKDGSEVVGFVLNPRAESAFVKYLVAADPSLYAAFREAAVQRSSEWALNLVSQGRSLHDPVVVQALNDGAWFIGMIDTSGAAYLNDAAQTIADPDTVDMLTKQVAAARSGVAPAVAETISTLMAGVEAVLPGPASAGVARVAAPAAIQLLSLLDDPPAIPTWTPTDAMVNAVQGLAKENAATAQASLQTGNTVTDVVVKVASAAGEPLLDPSGVPVVAGAGGTYTFEEANSVKLESGLWSVWDSAQTSAKTALAEASVVSSATAGANSTFVPAASSCAVGIGDQLGNWSDNGEKNSVYYGAEPAYTTSTWTEDNDGSLVPDADPLSRELRPVVPVPG